MVRLLAPGGSSRLKGQGHSANETTPPPNRPIPTVPNSPSGVSGGPWGVRDGLPDALAGIACALRGLPQPPSLPLAQCPPLRPLRPPSVDYRSRLTGDCRPQNTNNRERQDIRWHVPFDVCLRPAKGFPSALLLCFTPHHPRHLAPWSSWGRLEHVAPGRSGGQPDKRRLHHPPPRLGDTRYDAPWASHRGGARGGHGIVQRVGVRVIQRERAGIAPPPWGA